MNFAFFGTDEFAVAVLDTLALKGLVPAIVVTTPDTPKGRSMIITPPPVKEWAEARSIPVLQPERLRDTEFLTKLRSCGLDLYIVASYGKIIPKEVFELPKYKTLNIHPSLLPRYRGPSPVSTAILDDTKDTGVTVMQIDEKMDHGPIVAQEQIHIEHWMPLHDLEYKLATIGAKLLAKIIPDWMAGKIEAKAQDESQATYTKMVEKNDAEINLKDNPYTNYRKICTYDENPRAYTFVETADKKIRVQIAEASYHDGTLTIERVVPEGKKEMSYDDFLRGLR